MLRAVFILQAVAVGVFGNLALWMLVWVIAWAINYSPPKRVLAL